MAPTAGAASRKLAVPRPSASIMLISPTNQLLFLQRVKSSKAFPSAHVFPGGNLSSYHETVPAVDSPDRHRDGPSYRMAAIRETYEESGILLARPAGSDGKGPLLDLPEDVREEGRVLIHSNKVRFSDWLASVGGEADVDNLIPFTRWITPPHGPARFTTQMYLYLLPLESRTKQNRIVHSPSHDGGKEHTEATFADPSSWLARNDLILISPQYYLLAMLGKFFKGTPDGERRSGPEYYAERRELVVFLRATPTGPSNHWTSMIPWAEKIICPTGHGELRADGRATIMLDGPGPELAGTSAGGDWDRVILANRPGRSPADNELVWRRDAFDKDDARAKL